MASDKRQVILDTASDLMASFLYYDRKENESLGRGEIKAAITQGVVTVDELVAIFRKALEEATTDGE